MSVEGMQAVQARIAEIQSFVAPKPIVQRSAITQSDDSSAPNSFGSILSQAMSTVDYSTAGRASSAAFTDNGTPADLVKFGNGKIPTAELQPIGIGSHRLWAPAAQSFQKMRQDASRSGIDIGVTDSYRNYDQQIDVAERKGLYSQGGLAAKPGTSRHGWGQSLDLDLDDRGQAWMRANGGRYGFVEDTPREPWHWTFKPSS